MSNLDFKVNIDEIADKLQMKREVIEGRIVQEVKQLAASTHAFVVRYASEKLEKNEFMRKWFFGEINSQTNESEKVKFQEIGHGMYLVSIDESSRFIEEGRDPAPMATDKWLLKEGKGLKTAKDGSKYKVIPMKQMGGVGGKSDNPYAGFTNILKSALKKQGISLNKIERDSDGNPKLGILHRLQVAHPNSKSGGFHQMVSPKKLKLFSEGRTPERAAALGLPVYGGKFHLAGVVVSQRKDEATGKIKKEAVTFRVVSSKHKDEGRWVYPRVDPLNSIPEAFKFAEKAWEQTIKSLEDEFRKTGE